MIKGLENLCCEGRLEQLGPFSPENTRFITLFQYLQQRYKGDRASLLTKSHVGRTRSNSTGNTGRGFVSSYQSNSYSRSKHLLNNLPRGVAESPLLEVSKMQLDRVPGNLSKAPSPYHKKLEAPPTLGCSVGVSLERRAKFTVLFSRLFQFPQCPAVLTPMQIQCRAEMGASTWMQEKHTELPLLLHLLVTAGCWHVSAVPTFQL